MYRPMFYTTQSIYNLVYIYYIYTREKKKESNSPFYTTIIPRGPFGPFVAYCSAYTLPCTTTTYCKPIKPFPDFTTFDL